MDFGRKGAAGTKMKIANLLNEEPQTVVKLDNLPQYEVVNPSEEEIAKAAEEQKTGQSIVKKGSEAEAEAKQEKEQEKEEPKESPKASSSKIEAPVKNLISNLLDSLKKFISEI